MINFIKCFSLAFVLMMITSTVRAADQPTYDPLSHALVTLSQGQTTEYAGDRGDTVTISVGATTSQYPLCRQFSRVANNRGYVTSTQGIACQNPDGTWLITPQYQPVPVVRQQPPVNAGAAIVAGTVLGFAFGSVLGHGGYHGGHYFSSYYGGHHWGNHGGYHGGHYFSPYYGGHHGGHH